MCGIAAAFSVTGAHTPKPGWAIPHMRHRGPDGEGWSGGQPGDPALEHCRLAIIDPGNREADQPFSDPSGRWTIVYNGELFNYRQIRADLESRGVRFRTNSDTEVVLSALALEREEALRTFRGMFAFILWDSVRRELFAARDQLGVKPLYYTVSDGIFIAASELRTLIAHPQVRPRLDPAAVVEYLSFGFVAGSSTLLEGVFKLEPGHALTVAGGSIETSEYWDALPPMATEVKHDGSENVSGELVERLEAAVCASLVSDVPVSLMLSGGLDSSAIAALATRCVDAGDLTAYSVSFGLKSDESAAAAQLAGDLGMHHREIHLTRETLEEGFDDWLKGLDVPSANPTWIAVSCIADAVRRDGHKVLLSGDGGDELFGGYSRWMTYLHFHDRYWSRTPARIRRALGVVSRPLARGLAADIARRAREDGQLFVGSRPFHDDDLQHHLGPAGRDAARKRPPEASVATTRQHYDKRFPRGDQLAWMSYLALKTHLVEDYLVRLDTMGMGKSVEGRVPLLDVDLVRFGITLPQQATIGARYEQKMLFRRAVSSFLPDYITQRPKQGFCPPVTEWASTLLASRIPRQSVLFDDGLIDVRAANTLLNSRSVNASFALWTLGTLMVWCRENV
jgi:asparagine synthase (glutamine-hydrolysing)